MGGVFVRLGFGVLLFDDRFRRFLDKSEDSQMRSWIFASIISGISGTFVMCSGMIM